MCDDGNLQQPLLFFLSLGKPQIWFTHPLNLKSFLCHVLALRDFAESSKLFASLIPSFRKKIVWFLAFMWRWKTSTCYLISACAAPIILDLTLSDFPFLPTFPPSPKKLAEKHKIASNCKMGAGRLCIHSKIKRKKRDRTVCLAKERDKTFLHHRYEKTAALSFILRMHLRLWVYRISSIGGKVWDGRSH